MCCINVSTEPHWGSILVPDKQGGFKEADLFSGGRDDIKAVRDSVAANALGFALEMLLNPTIGSTDE